jgi:hypothetical protein
MSAKQVDPLKFAYVNVWWAEGHTLDTKVYKVFHVDDTKVRMRQITFADGKEVEGDNLWVPWGSINLLREIPNGIATS